MSDSGNSVADYPPMEDPLSGKSSSEPVLAIASEPSSAVASKASLTMTVEGHLDELRIRVLRLIAFLFVAVTGALYFSDEILQLVTGSASSTDFIYLSPLEPVMVKFRLSLLTGFMLLIPYCLIEVWAFARPGLKDIEKKMSILFVPPILISFFGGAFFAFRFLLPLAVSLSQSMAGPTLEAKFSIAAYSEFVLMFMLIFGLIAELPVIMILLGKVGLINSEMIGRKRPGIIVAIFILAGFFTPPDCLTQLLVAIPLLLLFEAGFLGLKMLKL
jgi:sec-independent protein translocase protein TatC